MEGELTPEQFETVLRMCDMLAIEDFSVATMMLKQANWNLQKALGLDQPHNPPAPSTSTAQQAAKPQPKKPSQPAEEYEDMNYNNIQSNVNSEPINYDYDYDNEEAANQFQYEYQYYQQQLDKAERIQQKKKKFDEGFPSLPLFKTKSECGDSVENKINADKQICKNYSQHREEYQNNLLEKSGTLCERILNSKSPQLRGCYESLRKNENNKRFITYLHNKYHSKINFTFGTLLLNLVRSYLDKKFLLVYIHKSQFQENRSIKMLLGQQQLTNFVNKNCINYGMFDSSDDYQVLQKYVPMRDLPAFALFKLDHKQLKEKFVSAYPVLQRQPENFLQWLAGNIGVTIKKKPKQQKKIDMEAETKKIEMSSIIYEQNFEYEEMERLYNLKREKSKARKQSEAAMELQIEQMKQNFIQQPDFEPGVTIQIRFRLPVSGSSIMRVFRNEEKVSKMFEYVHCFGRDQFEERCADFDLTQTFPKLSLAEKKEEIIGDVFAGSQRENIIVKQL